MLLNVNNDATIVYVISSSLSQLQLGTRILWVLSTWRA